MDNVLAIKPGDIFIYQSIKGTEVWMMADELPGLKIVLYPLSGCAKNFAGQWNNPKFPYNCKNKLICKIQDFVEWGAEKL